MQNGKIWELRGFNDYYVNSKGQLFRKKIGTKHHHYKSEREIMPNSRNQFALYRNSKKEYWSKKQLRNMIDILHKEIKNGNDQLHNHKFTQQPF